MDIKKTVLKDVELPDDIVSLSLYYAHATKHRRQHEISTRGKKRDTQICAAVEIQRCLRGYLSRCRLLNAIYPTLSKGALYAESKHHLARLKDVESPVVEKGPRKSIARIRLEARYQEYVRTEEGESREPMSFHDFCGAFIGQWWTKKRPKAPEPVKEPPKRTLPMTPAEAATIIQRSWRRHIDVQVFRYYRDLINFKHRGDPAMMLRCINPNEAKMLDPAAGVHIKFRLAGDRFPPNIYYKVFTHRPIQDLCANSPKDYTKPDAKRKVARDVHNKTGKSDQRDKSGWYLREENNGWRLVSDRLIHHVMSDPVTWDTSNKKVQFHHNKLKRKEDVEKMKKQRKIDWMKKMYKEGMLKAKVTDPDTVELIEGAAAGMVATIDSHGSAAVQDWEVDELLDWTTSLNFDDYWTGWKEVATSAASERPIADRFRLQSSQHDPFELTVSKAGHHEESGRPSHNTPVSRESIPSY